MVNFLVWVNAHEEKKEVGSWHILGACTTTGSRMDNISFLCRGDTYPSGANPVGLSLITPHKTKICKDCYREQFNEELPEY